jgi:uncharacterized protein
MRILPLLAIVAALVLGCASQSTGQNAEGSAAKPARVLIVGGGAHHDYNRWFNQELTAILREAGHTDVIYTDKPEAIASHLPSRDVLILSNNSPLPDPALRKAIFDFADSGRGLILLHPGLWYNWNDWPEYNRVLAGGGSRGHDRFGEFEVVVTEPAHPLMRGLPERFQITDELYWFEKDSAGTPIRVLATARSAQKNQTYPQVFVVEHPKTRVVGITLGHDGKAHELPAFRRLMQNSVAWAAQKR